MPDTPETILAFDYGTRRIGVAVGQQVTASANPLTVIKNGDAGPDWDAIEALIREWRPARLVVGLPLHADGSAGEITSKVQAFIDELARFGCPVESQDERYSSLEAGEFLKTKRTRGLSGRISKAMIDSAAATLIAQRWLERK
ncbi:MAG: Holliday junction resolvase RuvX [Woeseiaceae bacterium]|nr:Holliday junction resolvase RuvX [Woeseiaceae bacterium]